MISLDIHRIRVALHGVSCEVVEAATSDLESEFRRRLGPLLTCELSSMDIGELAIGPVHSNTVLDADTLRNVIAEGLAGAVLSRLGQGALSTSGPETGGV